MNYRTSTLLCALLLLSACGQSDSQPAPKLFKDQRDALDQAKALDATLQKQEEERLKALEQPGSESKQD
jgi:major membrane immunogen (membrane-anchored lipoprotein)